MQPVCISLPAKLDTYQRDLLRSSDQPSAVQRNLEGCKGRGRAAAQQVFWILPTFILKGAAAVAAAMVLVVEHLQLSKNAEKSAKQPAVLLAGCNNTAGDVKTIQRQASCAARFRNVAVPFGAK